MNSLIYFNGSCRIFYQEIGYSILYFIYVNAAYFTVSVVVAASAVSSAIVTTFRVDILFLVIEGRRNALNTY